MNLNGKIAIVTGGSSGIGKAIAVLLAKEGCKVIFTYNSNPEKAKDVLKQLNKDSSMFKVDMHSEDDINSFVEFVETKYKAVDILINNAGINKPRGLFNSNDWREIFQVDLFSVVHLTGKIVDLMESGARILNVTSLYGEGKACDRGIAPYGAAKAALNHYTQVLAKNLAPKILVNAVAPGYVRTPLWGNTSEEEFINSGKEQLIERMIQSEEIADMAISIVKNSAMTGEVVVVDGGLSLKTV